MKYLRASSGQLIAAVSGPAADIAATAAAAGCTVLDPGPDVAPGDASDVSRLYVTAAGLVASKPARPSPLHAWDDATRAWVSDAASQAAATAAAAEAADLKRRSLLAESDWLITRQQETGTPVPAEWLTFRQALRDITEQAGYPFNITWPTRPATS